MDTIIYLYAMGKEENDREGAYIRQDILMPDYQLIRVGMSGHLLEICDVECGKAVFSEDEKWDKKEGIGNKAKRSVLSRIKRRINRIGSYKEKKRKEEKRQQDRELLLHFLQEIWQDKDHSYFVCEEKFSFFEKWEFNGYFEAEWVRHMMRYVTMEIAEMRKSTFVLPDFVILGQTSCLGEVLYPYVEKIRSLQWILPQRQFREQQQDFVEQLYEEYGLAVDVRLLSEEGDYRRMRLMCRTPSIILDFSGEERISAADIAKGSIWLDMSSLEMKRRRMEDRDTGIHYFSLKKEWKQPQKARYHLDTASKNRYNT